MSKIQLPSSVLGMIGLVVMLSGFVFDTLLNNGNPTTFGSICLMVGASMMASGIIIGTFRTILNKERKQHGK